MAAMTAECRVNACKPVLLAVMALAQLCRADCVKKPGTTPGKPRHEPITVPTPVLLGHALKQVTPVFPPEAIAAKVDGSVIVALEIDHNGNVTTTMLLSGNALLRPAAEAAVKQWQFESFCIKGVPYTVRSALEFQFRWRGDGSHQAVP